MARIQMYTTAWCCYCTRAKTVLENRGLDYEEVRVDGDSDFRDKLVALTGRWTVPQIFIDGRHVGGYSELSELDRSGRLDDLTASGA
jgi:glutaredoxin 3